MVVGKVHLADMENLYEMHFSFDLGNFIPIFFFSNVLI